MKFKDRSRGRIVGSGVASRRATFNFLDDRSFVTRIHRADRPPLVSFVVDSSRIFDVFHVSLEHPSRESARIREREREREQAVGQEFRQFPSISKYSRSQSENSEKNGERHASRLRLAEFRETKLEKKNGD